MKITIAAILHFCLSVCSATQILEIGTQNLPAVTLCSLQQQLFVEYKLQGQNNLLPAVKSMEKKSSRLPCCKSPSSTDFLLSACWQRQVFRHYLFGSGIG
jgi:hypothetical protein